jgi:archaemetzincin
MIKIRVIPLGRISEEMLTEITENLRETFDVMTETTLPVGIPKDYYNSLHHQYFAPDVLKFLTERFLGKNLGITEQDIFAENLNFIFGMAQMKGNSSLVSIHRLNPDFYRKIPDKQLLLERAVKESIHEVGHMLGLKHCTIEKCVMNFSNTIVDVDKKNKELCGNCKRQLGLF